MTWPRTACTHGADMGLSHAQPQSLAEAVFGDLRLLRLDRDTLPLDSHHQALLGLTGAARAQWQSLHAWLGSDPQRTLARHRQALHLTWQEDARGWWVAGIARRDQRQLADYTGTTALLSAVPACTLDDVVGHDGDARRPAPCGAPSKGLVSVNALLQTFYRSLL